jgi:hypothetical protein
MFNFGHDPKARVATTKQCKMKKKTKTKANKNLCCLICLWWIYDIEIYKSCERKYVCCFMEWCKRSMMWNKRWYKTMMLFKEETLQNEGFEKQWWFKTNALQENVTLHKTNTLQDAKWRR